LSDGFQAVETAGAQQQARALPGESQRGAAPKPLEAPVMTTHLSIRSDS